MKRIWIALGVASLVAVTVVTVLLLMTTPEGRGVRPVQLAGLAAPPGFSRAESTGLFVGVRTFSHDDTLEVPYAVDDAVELAYQFSLDQRTSLVPPRRVVLALSGRPQSDGAKEKLRKLQAAGARIENATAGDIHHLLRDQTARAGANGMLVFSLATHGFLDDDGDAWVLGSTSAIGSTETSLRTAALFDIAGEASRSLIFVDACRDRTGQTSRGAGTDRTTAAPLLRKMARVEGQVIFYAAAPERYAFDDEVHQNGVFTKAVLDGLDCEASAPRGEVIVETLHRYVEREVRRWIVKNKGPFEGPATQISMEGDTHRMPLAQCWRSSGDRLRVVADGAKLTAYDEKTRPIWERDLGAEIVDTAVVDLDADGLVDVVVSMRDRITVLDRDGEPRWTKSGDALPLATFTTGDLFRRHTSQIVAVWADERSVTSRLTVLDSDGDELSRYEHPGRLRHVAVIRPTNMHAPKIAVTDDHSVSVLEPKKLAPVWRQALLSPKETIRELRIVDANRDARRDISVTTNRGRTVFASDGTILLGNAEWQDVRKRRRRE